jgi:YesN/AraC family two-component response regulator
MENTILVVEDEYLIARDLKDILTHEGYNVIINVDSVELAIEKIKEHNPKLVLIDINLKKDKDGVDLAAQLLEIDVVPYIFLTSNSDKITLERVAETRPYGFIVKPYKDIDVISTVKIVIDNFIHRNIDFKRYNVEINSNIPFILKQSISYINKHIESTIDIQEIAKKTPWGYNHYIRIFKEYVGLTPYQYVVKKRIERAETLLIETDLKILQISFNLGFDSHGAFTKMFKKITGQTPEQYRTFYTISKEFSEDEL